VSKGPVLRLLTMLAVMLPTYCVLRTLEGKPIDWDVVLIASAGAVFGWLVANSLHWKKVG
jgi:hypothetical protein